MEKAIPIVSIVGKISYGGAQTDVLVYAVPREYLDAIKIQPKKGKLYTNNQTFDNKKAAGDGAVAGAQTEIEEAFIGHKRNNDSYNGNQ